MERKEYILFHSEVTTWHKHHFSLYKLYPELIHISAIKIDKDYNILGKYNHLFRPKNLDHISFFCQQQTGINQTNLYNSKFYIESIQSFDEFVKDASYILSWNVQSKNNLLKEAKSYSIDSEHILLLSTRYKRILDVLPEEYKTEKALSLLKFLAKQGIYYEGRIHNAEDVVRNIYKTMSKLKIKLPV